MEGVVVSKDSSDLKAQIKTGAFTPVRLMCGSNNYIDGYESKKTGATLTLKALREYGNLSDSPAIFLRSDSGNIYKIQARDSGDAEGSPQTFSIASSESKEKILLSWDKDKDIEFTVGKETVLPGGKKTAKITEIVFQPKGTVYRPPQSENHILDEWLDSRPFSA
jgi:hypothetical protein